MSSAQKYQNTPRSPRKPFSFRLGSFVALIGLIVVVYIYGGYVLDWVRAQQFTPNSQLVAVSGRINLTPRGRQIFYATTPAIQDKNQFNDSCQSTERTTAILGCYHLDRIYLYNIQNSELDGTLEVTAAHELLHAAYSRLNFFERKDVDTMIAEEYQKVKDRPEISQLMKYYSEAEPGAEADELHSILGTTISKLSPDLERYFARYFTDRPSIVVLNAKYSAVFGELSRQADTLQKKISIEGPEIKKDQENYIVDLEQLNLDIQSFNTRANSTGGFGGQNEFSIARAGLLQRTATLNSRQNELNSRINAYNDLIERLNKITIRATNLNESINGVEAPSGVK